MTGRWLFLLAFIAFSSLTRAGEPAKDDAKKSEKSSAGKAVRVPFRLTDTNHTLVRVKINGKGPFNFVLDTGCPVLLIAEPVGKKVGLEKGAVVLDKLELEGGLELTKVKAQVETPFQITGMNSMGLAGVELHGLMGYTVLARFKMDFDYAKTQMVWTPLKFDPPPPTRLGAKGATAGMDVMTGLVQIVSFLSGLGPPPPPQGRGFCGFGLSEEGKDVLVAQVLPKSPAALAGLQIGDRIVEVEGKAIRTMSDVMQQASKLVAGKTLHVTVERDKKKQELKIAAGAGL